MSRLRVVGEQEIAFKAFARGTPKGSVRAIPRKSGGVYLKPDSSASLQDFTVAVQLGALEAMGQRELWLEPVTVRARFFFFRPKGHFGTGKNARTVKASAPALPCTRAQGDVDKLARALLDAMSGIVFRDDSQVAELEVYKRWADTGVERVEVEAWRNIGGVDVP